MAETLEDVINLQGHVFILKSVVEFSDVLLKDITDKKILGHFIMDILIHMYLLKVFYRKQSGENYDSQDTPLHLAASNQLGNVLKRSAAFSQVLKRPKAKKKASTVVALLQEAEEKLDSKCTKKLQLKQFGCNLSLCESFHLGPLLKIFEDITEREGTLPMVLRFTSAVAQHLQSETSHSSQNITTDIERLKLGIKIDPEDDVSDLQMKFLKNTFQTYPIQQITRVREQFQFHDVYRTISLFPNQFQRYQSFRFIRGNLYLATIRSTNVQQLLFSTFFPVGKIDKGSTDAGNYFKVHSARHTKMVSQGPNLASILLERKTTGGTALRKLLRMVNSYYKHRQTTSGRVISLRLALQKKYVSQILSEINHIPDFEHLVRLLKNGTLIQIDGKEYVLYESSLFEELRRLLMNKAPDKEVTSGACSTRCTDSLYDPGSEGMSECNSDIFKLRKISRKSVQNRSVPAHRIRFRYTDWILMDDESDFEVYHLSQSEDHSSTDGDECDSYYYADNSDSEDSYSVESVIVCSKLNEASQKQSSYPGHTMKEWPSYSHNGGQTEHAYWHQHARNIRMAIAEQKWRERLSSSDTAEEDLLIVVDTVSDY